MNKKNEVKLNMYNSVITHSNENSRIVETVPALQNSYTGFKTVVAAIGSTMQQQLQSTKGHAIGKAENRQSLCILTNEMGGALYAYATDKKDAVLKEKAKTSYSGMMRYRDEELAPVCRNIYDLAVQYQAELADYGLSAEVISAFKAAIDDYGTVVPAPRNAAARRIASTKALNELFKTADSILRDKIDKLIIPLRKTAPAFAETFRANRSIQDAGSTSTQVRIFVTNEQDGQPVTGAGIKLDKLNLQVNTNRQGRAIIKPVPQGVYDIAIEKEGYQPQLLSEVKLTLGRVSAIAVTLKKTA
jgi:hypothetical protein